MKTKTIIGALACGLVLADLPMGTSFADSVKAPVTPPAGNPGISARTAIVTAKGKLEGSLVPFTNIEGVSQYTGDVVLHYTARSSGFVDGDTSVVSVKLPKEFKTLAVLPGFIDTIKGQVTVQCILGPNTVDIDSSMIQVAADRIVITTPHQLWVGVADVSVDLNINYGQMLSKFPGLKIPDAPGGYEFVTQLKYNSAMWDFLKDPIIGTASDTFITEETSATS